MVKISPSAVVIFTILYLTHNLNALEGNHTSNHDDEDSAYVSRSEISKHPSSARFFHPSAWSKEENRDLKSNIDKLVREKEQDTSFFGEEFNSWNMKKLFRYVASLLYTVNESNERFLDQLANDENIKSQAAANTEPLEKSGNDEESELQNSVNNNNTLSKSEAEEKKQTSGNNNSNKIEINTNAETRNLPSPDVIDKSTEKRNSATNGTENEPSDVEEMQNTSNKDIPIPSRRQMQNSKNMKQNAINKDYLNKPAQEVKIQNPSNDDSQVESIPTLKSNQQREDSTTIIMLEDSKDKMDKIPSDDTADDTTDKSDEEEENESDTYNDDEREDEDGTDENNRNENEVEDEDDYVNENKNENEDESENNYDNEGNVDNNDVEDDLVSEYNDENRTGNNNQIPQTTVILDETSRGISPNITDQQKFSITSNPKSQINKKDYITGDKPQKNITKEKPSLENEITSREFIDDYINNRLRNLPSGENEQSNDTETGAASKPILKVIPTSENNFEEIHNSLNIAPLFNENTYTPSMPFGLSQNTRDKVWPERNGLLQSIFNEDKKDSNFNQDQSDEKYSQNIQNTFISDGESTLTPQKDRQDEPQNLISFQKNQYMDLPNSFATPQKDYNSFIKTPILDFQNYNPSAQAFYNGAPDINIYGPDVIEPFQLLPNRAIPLQNEYYLNDQYTNYNFPDVKTPDMTIEKNQPFEQKPPTISQQDMLSNIQYIPNSPAYFTYMPVMPDNVQNLEKPVLETESPSSYLISNNLNYDPSFNSFPNEGYPLINNDNILNKMVPEDQSDGMIPQNQMNKIETLNQQSDNLPFQGRILDEQMPFSQNYTETQLLQNEMTSRTLPDGTETKSETLSVQKEFKNMDLPSSQNGTKKSKEMPEQLFENAKIKPENKTENAASSSDVIQNNGSEPSFSQTKATSNKTLNDEPLENVNSDESEKIEQDIPNSDFGGNKNPDELSDYNDNTGEEETDYDEEETECDEEETEYDEEESEYDEEESENDDDETEEPSNTDNRTIINDETTQATQKSSSSDTNDTTEPTTTFKSQSEAAAPSKQEESIVTEVPPTLKTQTAETSPDQGKTFNSILEYIYKFSNNPLFNAIKNEEKQAS